MTENFNQENRSKQENDEEKVSELEGLVKNLEEGILDYEIDNE